VLEHQRNRVHVAVHPFVSINVIDEFILLKGFVENSTHHHTMQTDIGFSGRIVTHGIYCELGDFWLAIESRSIQGAVPKDGLLVVLSKAPHP
jgi:hypothetical protein